MGVAHAVEEQGPQPAGGGADHADPGRADHLVAQRRHVRHGRLELGGHPPAPFDDGLALLRQPASLAVDELHAQLLLQAGDVAGDVGLHSVQGGSGGREAAVVGDSDQSLQLPEVHRPHRYHTFAKTAGQIAP